MADLHRLRDRVDELPVALHAHEHGRARQVVVPEIVVNGLEVPARSPVRARSATIEFA